MIQKFKTKDHDEWLKLRHQYIGGSDAAAVVGLNPYSSPYKLWGEKTDKIPPFAGNIATETGTYLEPLVASMFARETGKKVRNNNFSMVNDKYPFAIANIDREIVGENAGLEIKTTSELSMKKFKNGEFPSNYYCQCMHYMAVTEKPRWYLACLIGNRELKIFTIDRDEEEISALMEAEKELYEHIKNDTPPAVDGSDCTEDAISAMYPNTDGTEIDVSPLKVKLDELMIVRQQIDSLETSEQEIINVIKAYMGESEFGTANGYKLTYKQSSRNTFQVKDFTKANPQIDLRPFYKTTTFRSLVVKEV